jgi:hypothetical protein
MEGGSLYVGCVDMLDGSSIFDIRALPLQDPNREAALWMAGGGRGAKEVIRRFRLRIQAGMERWCRPLTPAD